MRQCALVHPLTEWHICSALTAPSRVITRLVRTGIARPSVGPVPHLAGKPASAPVLVVFSIPRQRGSIEGQ